MDCPRSLHKRTETRPSKHLPLWLTGLASNFNISNLPIDGILLDGQLYMSPMLFGKLTWRYP
jgi:hypothetical protein